MMTPRMVPDVTRFSAGFILFLTLASHSTADDTLRELLDQRPQPWTRRDAPVLSARSDDAEPWRRVVCYSPHVIHHEGQFHIWYLGTSEASRSNDIVMGYATSDDGVRWTPHPDNPILTGEDVPWGRIIQTPFVLFDEGVFKMWFVSGAGVTRDADNKIIGNDQKLAYATSRDGSQWQVHPQPLYPSGRSPSIIKEPGGRYRMWMGSNPEPEQFGGIYANIYEFTSPDGLNWQRGDRPVIRPSEPARSCVYPFVVKEQDVYYMWYGCHVAGGKFELFCATSADGTQWNTNHHRPAFPAAADRERFDGRYTSTPCIVRVGPRWLLYYSARDWQNEYVDAQGRKRRDGSGVYADIGVAELRVGE